MYLTYADIGFLSAGQKYASEAFAKGNRKEEIDVLGFTGAILLLMIAPFSIAMIYFSFHPEMVLSELSHEGREIARKILLILGIVLPFQIILERLVQTIVIIRIKDYVFLRIKVIFNLVKTGSVFYFFSNKEYMIVEYFLFITLLMITSAVLVLLVIRKSENYNFIDLLKAIKLNKKQFNITKQLAFSSLILTMGWVIYYELDLIFIGKWFGTKEVAIYAIGFTFLGFLRTLWNSFFSPFSQRFNHFVVTKNETELKKLIVNIIDYSLPLCVIVTLTLVIFAESLTLFWVGNKYSESIVIMQVLILGTGFGFITSPASYYFIAKTIYRYIYMLAIVLPLTFTISVFLFTPQLGILGISISKSLAMFAGFVISIIGLSEICNPLRIIKKWFINLVIFSFLIIYFSPKLINILFLNFDKSYYNLVFLILIIALLIIVSYFLLLVSKKKQRNDLKKIYKMIIIKLSKT